MKFAVFGASGAGKSTLVELLHQINPNISVHKKDTTRGKRPSEKVRGFKSDLRFLTDSQFKKYNNSGQYDITYTQRDGSLYGVRKDQLLKAAENEEIHFVILNDISGIQKFKFKHRDARTMYIHADPRDIPENLQKREGVSCEERIKRVEIDYREFIDNSTLFNHVVVNFWDIKNAVTQMQSILHFYVKQGATDL